MTATQTVARDTTSIRRYLAQRAVTAFGDLAYIAVVYVLPFAAIIGLLWIAVALKI